MSLTVQVIGAEAVQARLGLAAVDGRNRINQEVERLGVMLLNKVKSEKLSGQVLNVKTGKLRRSMNEKLTVTSDSVTSSVGTNTVYARIHEFGGQTRAHRIEPKNGKALLFAAKGFIGPQMNVKTKSGRYTSKLESLGKGQFGPKQRILSQAIAGGGFVLVRGVNHPGSKIPMRSFLRTSLDEMRSVIQERLLKIVKGF